MSVNRSIHGDIKVVQALAPQVAAASANGGAIDLQGFDAVEVSVNIGAAVAAGAMTFALEESDSGTGGWTAVAADDINGAFVASVENTVQSVGYRGNKRYIRLAATLTGGTSLAVGSVAILCHAAARPTS